MRRALSSIALALVIGTAVLPGAAVFAQAPGHACDLDRSTRELLVDSVDVIVVAEVSAADGNEARLEPEAYLKGPATRDTIAVQHPGEAPCQLADFADGDRVLVLLRAEGGAFAWPAASEAYVLSGGNAVNGGAEGVETTEADLIAEIRGFTGQYAVPAEDPDDGASIEWVGTVVPVGLGLLAILGIGLVMMREWHRIDPS